MYRGIPAAAGLLALTSGLVGCDSTVALDTTKSQFSSVVVAGACKAPGDDQLGLVEVNTLLLTGNDADPSLTPTSNVRGAPGRVGSIINPESFEFTHTPSGVAASLPKRGFVELEGDPNQTPVALSPEAVEFAYLGDDPNNVNKRRLIIFLLDSSASIIGADPFGGGAPESAKASDRNDERITFFLQLLNNLREEDDDRVSLVWFNDVPIIRQETAAPTANRDLIRDALQNVVQFDENGSTQIAPALSAVYDQIIAANAGLQPVVILFTDGVEDEGALDLDAITERYRTRPEGKVPVIVLDLQPPPASPLERGRSAKLQDLACLTGGEYIFLENASQFTGGVRDLVEIVRNRIRGVWRLRVRTDMPMLNAGNYLLSTVLTATVGESQHADTMEKLPGSDDTRLWFQKN